MDIDIRPVGACGALVVLGSQISEATGARVAALEQAVRRAHIAGITESVPSFASLLVRYDPLRTDYDSVSAALRLLRDEGLVSLHGRKIRLEDPLRLLLGLETDTREEDS